MSAQVAAALVEALDDASLDLLAERLAPTLADRLPREPEGDRWMDTKEATRYLGLSVDALQKLKAAGKVPFHQEREGAKVWYLRTELHAWRRGEL
jgi:hypothetical protein